MKRRQWVWGVALVMIVLVTSLYYVAMPAFVQSQTTRVAYDRFVSGNDSFKGAQFCKTCHPKHYEQWSQSMHAQAFTEPHFVAHAERLSWSMPLERCLYCHAPLVKQGVANHEGITCEVCHGPGMTHAVVRDVCDSCHNQPMGETQPEPSEIISSTALEFEHSAAKRDGLTCPDCHMPKRDKVSFHGFRGSRITPESFKDVVRVESIERSGAQVLVTVKNTVTGHWVPTGTPASVLFLEVAGYNAEGQAVYEDMYRFEKSVYSFRYMPMVVAEDTRLRDGEQREVTFNVPPTVVRMNATLKLKRRPMILWDKNISEFVIHQRDAAIK